MTEDFLSLQKSLVDFDYAQQTLEQQVASVTRPTVEVWLVKGDERQLATEPITSGFQAYLLSQGISVQTVEVPAEITPAVEKILVQLDVIRQRRLCLQDEIDQTGIEIIRTHFSSPEKIWESIKALDYELSYWSEAHNEETSISSGQLLEILIKKNHP